MKLPSVPLFVFVCAASAGGAQAQLGVSAVSPARNALAVSTATNVEVTFDAPVDAATVSAATFAVFGRWSGARAGDYEVAGATVTWRPALAFFPGEMVTVALSEGLKSAGGDALASGHVFQFWTRSNSGTDVFALEDVVSTRLAGEGLIQSYGIYAADLDRDGAPDLSIPNEVGNDVRVLRNDGCGVYPGAPEVTTVPDGSVPSANEGADLNADGFTDFIVANIGGDSASVLLNDGAGSYLPSVTYPSGDAARGVAVLDLEADGDVDFAIALRNASRVALHRNHGDGTFAAATNVEAGVAGETSIITVDANSDGVADLFVGGYDSDNVRCLVGQGGATFAFGGLAALPGHPWMLAAGDVDGDGDVDAASCNSDADSASIVRGNGAGGWVSTQSYGVGLFPLAVDLGDADGDGDLDLVTSSYSAGAWTYYRNDGTGALASPTTFDATFAASCMVFVDDDRDGDVDLVGVDEIADEVFLFRQVSPAVPGVQSGACAARLRVNNLAGSAGFSALPPHAVSLGERVFVGLSGTAGTSWAVGVGLPLAPGIPTGFGLLNLAPAHPLLAGVTDAYGEAQVAVDLPPAIPPGSTAGLQGFAFPGSLTNPEVIVVVP